MKFCSFEVLLQGVRCATLDDFKSVVEKGKALYDPERQKYLYTITKEIVADRFFWMTCEYDNAVSFRPYLVDAETGEKLPNLRRKSQIELKKQLFVCFDSKNGLLYLSDMTKKAFVTRYFFESTQMNFKIRNVYSSVEDFCNHIKVLRGARFTQKDNLFNRENDIFQQISGALALDVPEKIQLRVGLGDIPVKNGMGFINKLTSNRKSFEDVVLIGVDDENIERTFDFSTIIKHIEINPQKDENDYYDAFEVKDMLLRELKGYK